MKKNIFALMAAAMLGVGKSAQSANKAIDETNDAFRQSKQHFLPDNGVSPKQYGIYIATKQSNIVKRKRRSKLAFG